WTGQQRVRLFLRAGRTSARIHERDAAGARRLPAEQAAGGLDLAARAARSLGSDARPERAREGGAGTLSVRRGWVQAGLVLVIARSVATKQSGHNLWLWIAFASLCSASQ